MNMFEYSLIPHEDDEYLCRIKVTTSIGEIVINAYDTCISDMMEFYEGRQTDYDYKHDPFDILSMALHAQQQCIAEVFLNGIHLIPAHIEDTCGRPKGITVDTELIVDDHVVLLNDLIKRNFRIVPEL